MALRRPRLPRALPLVGQLAAHGGATLRADLLAGLLVGLVTVPQALAYAVLAEVPPAAGLHAATVALVGYGVLGSAPQLSVGPVALVALMTASAVQARPEVPPLAVAAHLAVLAGTLLLLLRAFRFGAAVDLLGQPVLHGFVNGAVLLILCSQLPVLLGATVPEGLPSPARAFHVVSHPGSVVPGAAGLGVAALGLLLGIRRLGRLPPRWRPPAAELLSRAGPVLVMVLAVFATGLLPEPWRGFATVGPIPSTPPGLLPVAPDPALARDLLAEAAAVAIVVFVESFGIGAALAQRNGRRLEPEPEFVALGLANIGTGLAGAVPVAGSFSRSAAAEAAGATTGLSALLAALIVLLCALAFGPWIAALPVPVLGAVVVASVLGLLDWSQAWLWRRFDPRDFWTFAATLATVLALGVESGLAVGVFLSAASLVQRSSRPHMVEVGRVSETGQYRSIERFDTETVAGVAAVRIDEGLYFTNVRAIEDFVLATLRQRPELRHLLLVFSAVNHVDGSGLAFLRRLVTDLDRRGVRVHLAEVKWPVMVRLRRTDFVERLTGEVFSTTTQAMYALQEDT